MDFLNKHCYERYGVHPQPWALVDEWKFNDLAGQGATHILLTNGLNDIWSVGGYLEDLSPTIKAVVMPDGAHHSELTFASEDNKDTEDVKNGKQQIEAILGGWLEDIKKERL
jgi:lysosomal Pro-X carboxypeptidase